MNHYDSKTAQDICNLTILEGTSKKTVLEEVFEDRYPNAIDRIIVDCEMQALLGHYTIDISISDYNILSKHVTLLAWILINYGFKIEKLDTRNYYNVSGALMRIKWGQYGSTE